MFHHSILGGTFDRFHIGHQRLITAALNKSRRLTIGITTEGMLGGKKLGEAIEPYEDRENSVREFVEWNLRQCFCGVGGAKPEKTAIGTMPLKDLYGNSLEEKNIEAIFVSGDTLPGAEKINAARKKKGWPALKIVTVPFATDEHGKKISSERIRLGEIDREGRVYTKLFEKDLRLPEKLREELVKPWGKVINNPSGSLRKPEGLKNPGGMHSIPPGLIIAVGDIVSQKLIEAGTPADVNIIDGKTQRRKINNEVVHDPVFRNGAGTINSLAVDALIKILRGRKFPRTLFVEGEEDLLALPAILLSPLGSRVYYGLRGRGAVVVTVGEEIKERACSVLLRFAGVAGK